MGSYVENLDKYDKESLREKCKPISGQCSPFIAPEKMKKLELTKLD